MVIEMVADEPSGPTLDPPSVHEPEPDPAPEPESEPEPEPDPAPDSDPEPDPDHVTTLRAATDAAAELGEDELTGERALPPVLAVHDDELTTEHRQGSPLPLPLEDEAFDDPPTTARGRGPLVDPAEGLDLNALEQGGADPDDAPAERTMERRVWPSSSQGPTQVEIRARMELLLADARDAFRHGDVEAACIAAEAAEMQDPDGQVGPTLLKEQEALLGEIYRAVVGPLEKVPVPGVPVSELAAYSLDHRTGFLLSQIDGTLSFEELIDVAGMPPDEAYRVLARLLRQRIINVF
jgi:hypothetical protein